MTNLITEKQDSTILNKDGNLHRYSIEFFHIYTDEKINGSHKASLNYLKEATRAWNLRSSLIVLIDNYNPVKHTLKTEEVIRYLESYGYNDVFYAFEADMVGNAKVLLEQINSPKLKKSYINYVESKGKYPCSLLTATWYLTRLGEFTDVDMIKSTSGKTYEPTERLLNILPANYKEVEERALKVIKNSPWSENVDKIQDLFYPNGTHRKIDLF